MGQEDDREGVAAAPPEAPDGLEMAPEAMRELGRKVVELLVDRSEILALGRRHIRCGARGAYLLSRSALDKRKVWSRNRIAGLAPSSGSTVGRTASSPSSSAN